MPRNIDSTFKAEKAKQENQPIFLYTIENYDGVSDLHLAGYDADITYNSVFYSRFPIAHEFIGENNQGQIDQVKVRLANVSRLIQSYLEQYDFRGKKVITLFFVKFYCVINKISKYLFNSIFISIYRNAGR